MKKKLLLACVAMLVIAMIIAPVMAAPDKKVDPLNEILARVNTVLTYVNDINDNVQEILVRINTILEYVQDINNKLDAPPKPIQYEYYTASYPYDYWIAQAAVAGKSAGGVDRIVYDLNLVNNGDTPASLSYTFYKINGNPPYEFTEEYTNTLILPPKYVYTQQHPFSTSENDYYRQIVKISTNSPFVAPSLTIYVYGPIATGSGIKCLQVYLPGDFQKVEIYS